MSFWDFLNLFFIGSVSGWILELVYRRIFSAKKWINPGFLVGPWVPLYGFGLASLYALTLLCEGLPLEKEWLKIAVTILICGAVMTLIELLAGVIFIRGLKIKLWDYSDCLWNFKGIICPLFSLIWTGVAAVYVLLLHGPISEYVIRAVHPIAEYFSIGFVLGIFLTDVAYSLVLSIRISGIAKDLNIVVQYEKLKQSILIELKRLKRKRNFLFALRSEAGLVESIKKYAGAKIHLFKEKR